MPGEEKKEEKRYQHNFDSMIKLQSFNESKKFGKILKHRKFDTSYFTVYFSKNVETFNDKKKNLNISFVMKKKIGNAVKRNKIKRKLKSAVRTLLEDKGKINLNYTYVMFGKNSAYKEKFSTILSETKNIFKKINS